MDPLTEQELFDKVVAYARTMKTRARNNVTGTCYYREPNTGNRCFIGHLIPDDEYKSEWDSDYTPSSGMQVMNALGLCDMDSRFGFLANALQVVHDTILMQDWETAFADMALDYGLAYTPPATSFHAPV